MATGGSRSLVEFEEVQIASSHSSAYATEEIFNSSSSDGEETISEDEQKATSSLMDSAMAVRK